MSDKGEWRVAVVERCCEMIIQLGLVDKQKEDFGIHLAIFVEPYLGYVLEGKKTIESRFSINRCAPYRQVSDGDFILLKRQSGPIVGIARISQVWTYDLVPESFTEIRDRFAKALCADDPSFWNSRERASHATLMKLDETHRVLPFDCSKRDRRGWVVLRQGGTNHSEIDA